MAKLISQFPFLGSLGEVSAYKMRGVDHIILRRKGGASKRKIKTHPDFVRTRENNSEFGGRATAVKWVRQALSVQKAVADYNIAGTLNGVLQPAQQLDDKGRRGKRAVLLSRNPQLLQGFSLNRKAPFDSIIRNPPLWSLLRDTRSARIDIPELLPGINFFAPDKHPMFRITAVLGIVPDVFYTSIKYKPSSNSYRDNDVVIVDTDWRAVRKNAPATTLEMTHPTLPPDQSFSLVLSIGICFGTMSDATTVQQVKYAGAAKILAAV